MIEILLKNINTSIKLKKVMLKKKKNYTRKQKGGGGLVHIKHYLLALFVVVAMRIQNGSLVWKNNSRKEPKLMAKYSWRISKMYLESDRFGNVCVQQFDRILSSCLYRAYLLTFVHCKFDEAV